MAIRAPLGRSALAHTGDQNGATGSCPRAPRPAPRPPAPRPQLSMWLGDLPGPVRKRLPPPQDAQPPPQLPPPSPCAVPGTRASPLAGVPSQTGAGCPRGRPAVPTWWPAPGRGQGREGRLPEPARCSGRLLAQTVLPAPSPGAAGALDGPFPRTGPSLLFTSRGASGGPGWGACRGGRVLRGSPAHAPRLAGRPLLMPRPRPTAKGTPSRTAPGLALCSLGKDTLGAHAPSHRFRVSACVWRGPVSLGRRHLAKASAVPAQRPPRPPGHHAALWPRAHCSATPWAGARAA